MVLTLENDYICVIGDFNCIRDDSERSNCVCRRLDITGFNEFINDANLLELSLSNSEFTWFGPLGRKSRLDRVFVIDKC